MNFRKSSEGGGGSFPIQKIMLQIFAIIKGTFVHEFRKKRQHDFPKMRGESRAVWNFSENSSVLVWVYVPKSDSQHEDWGPTFESLHGFYSLAGSIQRLETNLRVKSH